MGTIERTKKEKETLELEECPCCNGNIKIEDCGYSSFNPGWATCESCARVWKLGWVDDQWDCGLRWNERATEIQRKLQAFSLITIDNRNVLLADIAKELVEGLKVKIIGAET